MFAVSLTACVVIADKTKTHLELYASVVIEHTYLQLHKTKSKNEDLKTRRQKIQKYAMKSKDFIRQLMIKINSCESEVKTNL